MAITDIFCAILGLVGTLLICIQLGFYYNSAHDTWEEEPEGSGNYVQVYVIEPGYMRYIVNPLNEIKKSLFSGEFKNLYYNLKYFIWVNLFLSVGVFFVYIGTKLFLRSIPKPE